MAASHAARRERRPAIALAALAVAGVIAAASAALLTIERGWLGVRLAPGPQGCAAIASLWPGGPLERAGARAGDCLIALGAEQAEAQISSIDIIEDADQIASRAEQSAFLARQSRLADLLGQPVVRVTTRRHGEDARIFSVTPGPRPAYSLPPSFWTAVVSGLVGLIVGAWVWTLRRGDPAARWLGLSGLGLFLAATPAAIYGGRELALSGQTHATLSLINHLGGAALGLSLACLFLDHPARIGPRWLRTAFVASFLLIAAIDLSHLAEPLAFYWLGLAQMMAILLAWGAQTLIASRDPKKRAALIWLGVSVVFGVGASALGLIVPVALGAQPLLSQSYLFAFYAAFFGSVAIAVGRHNMFDLGRWSYGVLFYALGAATMLAIDAALIYGLNFDRSPALILSILAVGLTYLPARDAVWRRYAAPRRPPAHEVFGKAMDVAFGAGESEQDRLWRALLRDLFDPLETSVAVLGPGAPTLAEGRVELVTPAVGGSPALRLRHPYGGKALFSADDLKMATRIVELVRRAERARDEHARGVIEERARIARDLHDDLGARLLAGAVGADSDARALSQAALTDLRSILADLSASASDLEEGLANLRQETAERLADAGLTLDWPPIDEGLARRVIDPRRMKALASCVREAVSNAIRHSHGQALSVRVAVDDRRIAVTLRDDGRGLPTRSAEAAAEGRGLINMRERMRAADGEVYLKSNREGVAVTFDLPLRGRRPRAAAAQPLGPPDLAR